MASDFCKPVGRGGSGRGGRGGRGGGGGGSSWKRCKACGAKGHTVGDCPLITSCTHCGSKEHTAKRCTFGARPAERFLPCEANEPVLPCFWRRFLVPLQRADAETFDPLDPKQGRADVGLRCIGAGLFRSQGLRRNSQVCIAFGASGHTLEVSGALVRDLRPDDRSLGLRVRQGLDSLLKEGCGPPDPELEPEKWSASELRGFETRKRKAQKALASAVKCKEGENEGKVVVMFLAEDGLPIAKACAQLRDAGPLRGVLAVVGDDRGLPEEEATALREAAEGAGAEVMRVSLGATTLLASHAIVILHHHLDESLHCCKVAAARDYGFAPKRPRTS